MKLSIPELSSTPYLSSFSKLFHLKRTARNDGTSVKKTQVIIRIVLTLFNVWLIVKKVIDKILTMTNPNGDVYVDCKIVTVIVSTF